jgi:hypothetical protein
MNTRKKKLLLTVGAFLFLIPAASADCDCNTVAGRCQANVTLTGNTLEISASANQCAWVTFHVNGTPQSSTFNGGRLDQEWRGAMPGRVDSVVCRICSSSSAPPAQTYSPAPSNGGQAAAGNCAFYKQFLQTMANSGGSYPDSLIEQTRTAAEQACN